MNARWGLSAALLAVFIAFSWWTIQQLRLPIQADIQKRADAALVAVDFEDVSVSTDGRDVTLSGEVYHPYALDKAVELVSTVWGVRTVHNALQLIETEVEESNIDLALFHLMAEFDGHVLALNGRVTDNRQQTWLQQHVAELFPQLDETSSLQSGAQDFPAADDILALLLKQLAAMHSGTLSISAEGVKLSGIANNAAQAETLRAGLQGSSAGLLTVPVDLSLQIAPRLDDDRCAEELNAQVKRQRIHFEFAKAAIDSRSYYVLDRVATIALRCDARLQVAGYTDSKGDARYNRRLSAERAAAVQVYLVDKGVDAAKLSAKGYGAEDPVADNSTKEGRAMNRRIEFKIITAEDS
jgi:outer membrane protein OmpA-like peptidoglycan-associated protein